MTEETAPSGRDEALAQDAELTSLLAASHSLRPGELPGAVRDAAVHLGARDAVIQLVDLGQRYLVPFLPGGRRGAVLEVDTTTAGRAYRSGQTLELGVDGDDTRRVVAPLLDGSDRLGVIELTFGLDAVATPRRCETFASLVAELVVSKSLYGDDIARTRRLRTLDVAAELRWMLLPPLTFGNEVVSVAGILEPAYEVAGDTFDYAVDETVLHVALFDAMGHGLEASRMSNLALGAYRNGRRSGAGLVPTFLAVDAVVAAEFGTERFVTGQLATLELATGRLQVLSAGHPAPLLLRGGRVVGEMRCDTWLPFGLGDAPAEMASHSLEPGDRVLFYTDGVIEAKTAGGEPFGLERLADLVQRSAASHEAPAEMVRRLAHAVQEFQGMKLADDATLVLVGWDGAPAPAPFRPR